MSGSKVLDRRNESLRAARRPMQDSLIRLGGFENEYRPLVDGNRRRVLCRQRREGLGAYLEMPIAKPLRLLD